MEGGIPGYGEAQCIVCGGRDTRVWGGAVYSMWRAGYQGMGRRAPVEPVDQLLAFIHSGLAVEAKELVEAALAGLELGRERGSGRGRGG